MKHTLLTALLAIATLVTNAQSWVWTSSTQENTWKQSTVKCSKGALTEPILSVDGKDAIVTFKAWGTCFNELGWDALNILSKDQQESILSQIFSKDGELCFTMGRFSMNANDYSRNWYSCDEVDGDFQLKYFHIDRDKSTLIPYIKAAMKYNPDLTFWISPWSPPSWMKINHYYSVRSREGINEMDPQLDYLLFEGKNEKNDKVFPKQLAVNDYLIQDPRYLKTYADYFCKFISAYQEEGIPITKVMFQNESWSYTAYPGCAWTPEGIIRFNAQYLAPAMKEKHPNIDLYFGTINTNRFDFIDQVLSHPDMAKCIKGIGLQWEGGQILPLLREKYPSYKYVQTESECGWGSFDWKAAEHTFELMNHYLGNGCEEYTFWNVILADNGESGWGWKQNSLIRVDSQTKTATYTPEYFAVKHYTHYIKPDTRILTANNDKEAKVSVMVAVNPQDKYIVIAGNYNETSKKLTVKLGEKYLNITLPAHSFNTLEMK